MPLPTLMILDENPRTSLGIVRSLGRLGIPIIVGSADRMPKSGLSRYVTRHFRYPPREAGTAATHAVVIAQVRLLRPAVLMPVGSPAWPTIYDHYEEYAKLTAIVPSPGPLLFKQLNNNKDNLELFARRCNIPVPTGFRPESRDEALALRDQLPYPVVLKPRVGAGGMGIRSAENPREFAAALSQSQDAPLIQERIDGADVELTILSVQGEPLAVSAYMTLRNYPIPYGHLGGHLPCQAAVRPVVGIPHRQENGFAA